MPYGKTLIGKIFYFPQKDGTNYWCEEDLLEKRISRMKLSSNEYIPIFFVDHSIDCSYAHKAVNVQKKGGRVMLIASDSNILEEEYNVDDPTESASIPTIIIDKEFGDIIRKHNKLKKDKNEFIIISMKFSGVKEGGYVELELFMRSDDEKARDFFSEFEYYKEKLGKKLKFTPIYKYSKFVNQQFDNTLSEKTYIPCIKETRMCATPNYSYQIDNARKILLENIRETCIYQEFGQETYWNYMIQFNILCFDMKAPLFNEECAMNVFKKVGNNDSDYILLKRCMNQLIQYESKIDSDYSTFLKRKIYSIPDLFINGVPYRGSWYSKYIFRSICNGFLDDSKICEGINPKGLIYNQQVGNTVLAIIIIIIVIVTSCSLLCYKRYINKSVEDTINGRIQEQTMKVISQYKQFKDSSGGAKLELVNE